MKLEVGMYVRTKHNGIKQINALYSQAIFTDTFIRIENEQIIKASHNIMDLIEEGDFVKVRIDGVFINCFMVDLFEDENENQELGIGCYEDGLLNSISEYRPLNTLEILEVVTKEQFKSISYEVSK